MERNQAKIINEHASIVFEELSKIILVIEESRENIDYEDMRRVVGKLIGETDMFLCQYVYSEYPELDEIERED